MKKFTSFCQALKKMHTKEYWFLFFCLTVTFKWVNHLSSIHLGRFDCIRIQLNSANCQFGTAIVPLLTITNIS